MQEISQKEKEIQEEEMKKKEEEERKLKEYEEDPVGKKPSHLYTIAGLDILYNHRKITVQQLKRFTRELEFMPLRWIERYAADPDKNIGDMYTMGVVTERNYPIPMKKDPTNSFGKFKITDLKKRDDVIAQIGKAKAFRNSQTENYLNKFGGMRYVY